MLMIDTTSKKTKLASLTAQAAKSKWHLGSFGESSQQHQDGEMEDSLLARLQIRQEHHRKN